MKIDNHLLDSVEESMDQYHQRFERFFSRSEPREQSRKYLQALISSPDRRNGWELAESAGDAVPDPTQRLMYRSHWDVDGVLDEHMRFASENIGDPDGTFVADETGFLKSGKSSAGVQRQYTGTAGKITNCQIGTFLGYTSHHGSMLLDRRLYMPKSWLEDPERCKRAKVPENLSFLTKPAQALEMLHHAIVDLHIPGRWVTGDEVYGNDPKFRRGVAKLGLIFVVAVSSTSTVKKLVKSPTQGRPELSFWPAKEAMSVDRIARNLPATSWALLTTKAGETGPIQYWWAAVRVMISKKDEGWLLVRRSVKDRDDLAFYFSNAGPETTLLTLATVALRRAAIEQCFAEAKTEAGLDEYEVRLWTAWYCHITLAMMAHAFLVATKKTLADAIMRIRSARQGCRTTNSPFPNRHHKQALFHGLDQIQGSQTPHGNGKPLSGQVLSGEAK
jgi:SRSO17 transposase